MGLLAVPDREVADAMPAKLAAVGRFYTELAERVREGVRRGGPPVIFAGLGRSLNFGQARDAPPMVNGTMGAPVSIAKPRHTGSNFPSVRFRNADPQERFPAHTRHSIPRKPLDRPLHPCAPNIPGKPPSVLMSLPKSGTRNNASQAMYLITRLIGRPINTGSRYEG